MAYNNYYIQLLKEVGIDIDIYCRDLFKGLMALRDIPYTNLWIDIGCRAVLSNRTIQDYAESGKLRSAKAFVLLRIADRLDVDPYCLIGKKSIMDVWNKESKRVRNAMMGDDEIPDRRIETLRKYTRIVMDAEAENRKNNSAPSLEEMMKLFKRGEIEDRLENERRDRINKKLPLKKKR